MVVVVVVGLSSKCSITSLLRESTQTFNASPTPQAELMLNKLTLNVIPGLVIRLVNEVGGVSRVV